MEQMLLLVAMDDERKGHPTFIKESMLKHTLQSLMFSNMPYEPLDADEQSQIDAIAEALLQDGAMHFEGDPPIYCFKLSH